MKTWSARASLVALAILASLFASPTTSLASNHSTDFEHASIYSHENDSPELRGSPWYPGLDGHGYGDNNYDYTYVKGAKNLGGKVIDRSLWARWIFSDVPPGDCTVAVFVPSERATATVQYEIFQGPPGNFKAAAVMTQRHAYGWTYLTDFRSERGQVRIYLLNYSNSRAGWISRVDGQGPGRNQVAADAVRLECYDLPTSNELKKIGNNVSGTLSGYYEILYQRFLMASNNSSECDDNKKDSSLPWITTSRIATTNGPINADGNRNWIIDRAYDYTFPIGECTSWVQFRLRTTSIPSFDNGYLHEAYGGDGGTWGDAHLWDSNAASAGVTRISRDRSNYVPKKFSVAQWNTSPVGHVAFVEAVSADGNTIWISEMNNGDLQVCYLRVRKIERDSNRSGVWRWPDYFIEF